jgi:purine-nucleoside phosphorylase
VVVSVPALDVQAASAALVERIGPVPVTAVVLGSGLGPMLDALDEPSAVEFGDLPGLPAPTVAGHGGRFVAGRLEGTPVLLQAGRFHAYEGHRMDVVAAPVRVLAAAGVRTVVMTNAVGGIHRRIAPGDLVLLDDCVNLTFRSPLTGPVVGREPRCPDMSAPFDPGLQELARSVAADLRIPLGRGVYAGVLGPSYETAAEIRMLGRLGGDVVGMSTVPEVIGATAAGIRCVGISLVTNRATGTSAPGDRIAHEDVLAVGQASAARLGALVTELVRRVADGAGPPHVSTNGDGPARGQSKATK